MKVITLGHKYELKSFENPKLNQTLQFIEKSPNVNDPTQLDTLNDGTTNEEVIEMLIDRMNYLQNKFPCIENELVINNLTSALDTLNSRTKDRKSRGVEGKHIK
mgnify:CR=1 FL=1